MKKYIDFINESKLDNELEFLLEANINYTPNFTDILNKIDNPISREIKKLSGKEVNVNTNVIDLDFDKIDYILFTPDDKIKMVEYRVTDERYSNYPLTMMLDDSKGYEYPMNGRISTPDEDEIVEIVKSFTMEELSSLISTSVRKNYSHITWSSSFGTDYHCLYETEFLIRYTGGIKQTSYKVGKFVNNLLKKAGVEFSPKDVEAFVDKFKSEMKKKKDIFSSHFKIVKGEDIRKYYLQENYFEEEGTLGNSCMRYSYCQKFLDIYVDNDVASLIIFMSDNLEDDKIVGRALLWDATQKSTGAKIKLMDRVYVSKSNDTELFKQFAIKNGFHYKEKQDYSDTPFMFNDTVLSDEDSYITVDLEYSDFDYYPYVDTVKYLTTYDDTLRNFGSGKLLNSTEGGCETCSGEGTVTCYNCEGETTVECSECEGDGYEECDNCGGQGDFECGDCEGSGERECRECDGSGKDDDGDDCQDCNGKGNVECGTCDGNGKYDCEECRGDGRNSCGRCDGDGTVECYNCDGRGDVECPDCQ